MPNQLHEYARYSGLAIQMIVILLVFVGGGYLLDDRFNPDGIPFFTIGGSLVGIFVALYLPLKSLTK